MSGQRGFALLLVLWVIALLSTIAVTLASGTRSETQLAHNAVEGLRARSLADAGIWYGVHGLLRTDAAQQWRVDGYPYTIRSDDGEARVSIYDEAGKLDLIDAPDDQVRALILATGLVDETGADALVAALGDWHKDEARPPESMLLTALAAQRHFRGVEELQQVPGMSRALYRQLAPDLTVYVYRNHINPMTASPRALQIVPGMTADIAAAILATRSQPLNAVALAERIGALAEQRFGSLRPSTVFTVRAEAQTKGGARFVRSAVISLERPPSPPFIVHSWEPD